MPAAGIREGAVTATKEEDTMPIYEYKCESCGAINEYLVFGDSEEIACKSCNGTSLTKLMSAHNTTGSGQHNGGHVHHGGCCGSPNSCGNPGSCCSG